MSLQSGLRLCLALLAAWLCLACLACQAAPMQVTYPGDDARYAQYIELLRKALERTVPSYGPYTMRPSAVAMNESRFLKEAREGRLVNVVWSATSIEKEASLRPIRIPLEKGLLGYRIALVQRGRQARFDAVNSLADLRGFSFGLGRGWGDVPIYEAAGLKVQLASYDSLFKMLAEGRFDLYSRGVNEVFEEFERWAPLLPDLAVEQHLLLHYPYPFYFFVTPTDEALASRIEAGLRAMLADGSFDAIFHKYNDADLARAHLAQRHRIELVNPRLPPGTPLDDKALWYTP